MLISLSIRDVVLIERLDLTFDRGLCVLTGETGAGKSILLDALGLALGARADSALLRNGAEQASVAAVFEVPEGHSVGDRLAAQGLETDDGQVVLRRVLGRDGRNRAFVNDQPVSAGLLRNLGEMLVEIQGQFEAQGLLDSAGHRALVDAHGGLAARTVTVAELWRAWHDALTARETAAQEIAQARREDAFLRHAVAEIEALDPQPGEEATLTEQRSFLVNAEKLAAALTAALGELEDGDGNGAEEALAAAQRGLGRVADKAGGRLDPVLAALDRAAAETAEALAQLRSVAADIEHDSGRAEAVEERLFALRDLARKHGVEADSLAALRDDIAARIVAIEHGDARLADLARRAEAARGAYLEAAEALSKARKRAAVALDKAVNVELPPLKLDKARFVTRLARLDEPGWGPQGLDRVVFEVATNPGSPPGPLARIASGGELARFLLALKVVLAEIGTAGTLVFDEVDAGVGGPVAHAVGERLERLGRDRQVLVVTHSPQVGARGAQHWRVYKESVGKRTATRAALLGPAERREEIARMLSGARITEEARAAAGRLMEAEAG